VDTSLIIGEVVKRHQVMLDPHDPLLVAATVSEMAMEPAVDRMEAIATRCEAAASRCEMAAQDIREAVPVKEIANRLIRSFEPTGKRIAVGLTRQAFAWLAGIAVALLFGGAVIGGVGVWYWLDYVPTHYVYVVDQPGQQHVAPR
jgi:hypothetical protein